MRTDLPSRLVMALLCAFLVSRCASLRSAEEVEIWDEDGNNWTDTFTEGDPIDTTSSYSVSTPASAVDAKGRLYTTYIQSDGTYPQLYLVRYDGGEMMIWDNGGSSWTDTFSSGDPIGRGNTSAFNSPRIGIDSKDRVYVALRQGVMTLSRYDGTDVKIWDNGASSWTDTFTNADGIEGNPGGGAGIPYAALVDGSDRVYIPHTNTDGTRVRLFLSRYDGTDVKVWDNGDSSWTDTFSNGDPIDAANDTTVNDAVAAKDTAGRVYVAYRMYDGTTYRLYLSRYDGTDVKIWDNGDSSWTDTFSSGDPIDHGTANSVTNIAIASDSADRVYVAFAQSDGTNQSPYLVRFDGTDVKIWDNGAPGWTDTFSSGDSIGYTSSPQGAVYDLKIDGSDRVYVLNASNGSATRMQMTRYDGTNLMIWDHGTSAWTTTLSSGDDDISANSGSSHSYGYMTVDSQGKVYYTQLSTPSDLHLHRYDGTGFRIWDTGTQAWTTTMSSGDRVDRGVDAHAVSGVTILRDAADRVYMTYIHGEGTTNRLYVTRYRPEEATTYDARVSVFYQGVSASNARAMGSLVGIWNFAASTFGTDITADWMKDTPRLTGNGAGYGVNLRIARDDPRHAFAASGGKVWHWGGTSWRSWQLNESVISAGGVDAISSSFAMVGGSGSIHRWTGTTWIRDAIPGSLTIHTVDLISTIWGIASSNPELGPGVYRWTGTSWLTDMPNPDEFATSVAAVDTGFAWALNTRGFWLWRGTSWVLNYSPGDEGAGPLAVIRGERDFALSVRSSGIYRWNGVSWRSDAFPVGYLNAAVAVQTDWAWAVSGSKAGLGIDGNVFRWSGTSWLMYGPLTVNGNGFYAVDAVDTDWAVAAGAGGVLWVWRGTSWRNESLATENLGDSVGRYTNPQGVATAGPYLTFVGGTGGIFRRQVPHVSTASSQNYRAVVQISPRGSMWTWAGTSDTQSYFGLPDHGSAVATEFRDSSEGTGNVTLNRTGGNGSSAVEDIFIWVDTVGGWDGISSPHNANSATGLGLVESGGVDNSPSGADAWGESDRRISCADGGTTDWTTKAGNTGAGPHTVIRDDMLTWETWHHYAGATSNKPLETALHVAAGPFGAELAGLRWRVQPWIGALRLGTWRWCRDSASMPQVMAPERVPLAGIAPTGEKLRLRVRVDEIRTGSESFTHRLQYSTDRVNWTLMTEATSEWKQVDGQESEGSQVDGLILSGSDTKGMAWGSSSTPTQTYSGLQRAEMDVAIESSAATAGATYYFRPRNGSAGNPVLPRPGVAYPSVTVTADATFNYLYSEASKGPFGKPVRNLQTISGGNGEAFKVAYVTTQSGSSDKVYAVSRTDGAIARSYTASGTLDYPLICWDSTNARYNLFFVQSGYRILALTDDGGTITANTAWASDGLKSFGNTTADLLGEPVRIFDSDKQNYLYFIVTSYQNNTNTLYKVRASDGTVVTGGNYSASAPTIGVSGGLNRLPPLYVDGSVYALPISPSSDAVKIPASGGSTSWAGPNDVLVLPLWYTRDTVSSGPRVLAAGLDNGYRLGAADMSADTAWDHLGEPGLSDQVSTPVCGVVSPPFQLGSRVPAYVGGGSSFYRLNGTTGDLDFTYALTGQISSGIALNGNWAYFGTSRGYLYALSTTDPTQTAGTRFRVPGDSPVVGVHLDVARSIVYYTTADGRVYQFDTR